MNKKSNLNLISAVLLILGCVINVFLAYNNYAIAKNNGIILQNNELIFEQLTKQMQIINQMRMNEITSFDSNCHTDIYKYNYQNNTFYLIQSSDYDINIKGWNEENYRIGTELFKFHKVCK